MGGFHRFGKGDSEEKLFLARPSKKICPKCTLLGTSGGVIWGDLRTFWSDFSDFRMQNQSVL